MRPIFMIGMQRSGSNLLRLMLNQLQAIASPHPPHILKRLYPLLGHYGDLDDAANFARLTDDVCRLVELNPVPWEGVELKRSAVLARCRDRSLIALHGAVYDLCAAAWNAHTWCCKSLANIRYVDEIERYFVNPRYIYLYRDGRDVALSFRKAVVGEKHAYHVAKGWAQVQEVALALKDRIDPSRLISVSYEQLTTEPERTARKLCEFLAVDYSEGMLEFHHSEEARRAAGSSALWGQLTKPVMNNNTKKFLLESSEDDIRIFESVAGYVLDRLGYERVHIKRGQELAFNEKQIMHFSDENEQLKQRLVESVDLDDLERRQLQDGLLREIASRCEA